MFENVNTPQTPPNQPTPKEPKDWGPWKPVNNTKKTAGPIPPPPLNQESPTQISGVPPTQNHNVAVPSNVNVPGGVPPDLPEPNKRKFVLIGIIIFALLIVLIAGAIFALDYFSNTNENVNNINSNEVTNSTVNTNSTINNNTNENINTIANKNLNSIFDVNTNTETNLNSNTNNNSNKNLNVNENTNTIINSALLDSDNDGLTDENEKIYGTDRINPDTDGDGYLDGDEIKNGYNPLCNPATAVAKGCNTKLL